jgi:protein-disulfide isomerase
MFDKLIRWREVAEKNIAFILMGALSVAFAAAAAVDTVKHDELLRQVRHVDLARMVMNVNVSHVTGQNPTYLGGLNCPYTLVEFGDYQCPPCHLAYRELKEILPGYRDRIRFCFRNLPLTTLHPYAMSAALVAETARQQGKFWRVHDCIYDNSTLSYAALTRVIAQVGITGISAQSQSTGSVARTIQTDISDAKVCGIRSTPSFVLCCPNGKVFHLDNLTDVKLLVH